MDVRALLEYHTDPVLGPSPGPGQEFDGWAKHRLNSNAPVLSPAPVSRWLPFVGGLTAPRSAGSLSRLAVLVLDCQGQLHSWRVRVAG
jgi:hypothetical protein